MLCPGDARLADADVTLPGLRRLLDPAAYTALVQALFPDAAVSSVAPRYVRYKPGTSCLVAARATTPAGEVDLYGRAHDPDRGEKIAKADEFRGVRSVLGPATAVDRTSAVAVYVFPNDHELRGLRGLADQESRAETLRRLLPDHDRLDAATIETIRWKPERRYVARVRTPAGIVAAIKLYTEDDYRLARKSVKAFESGPRLRVAATLRRSDGLRATVVEWLPGTPLNDALTPAGCAAAGAALAAMHEQTPRKLRRKCDAGGLAEIVTSITALVPALTDAVREAADRIDTALADLSGFQRCAVHGDFTADQMLIDDGVAGVVDFDRAGWGDPRLDLGSFRARLTYLVLAGGLAADDAERGFAALLDAYSAAGRSVAGPVEPFTASTLLRLATEPFRYRHADWPDQVASIVSEARRLVTTTAASDA